jgi:Zn ribbon nucleic-acid-binding protein
MRFRVIVNTMMANVSHEDNSKSDDELEIEANRELAKRLAGARLHLIGQTVINYLEYKPAECPICECGEKIKAYDKIREHAVCIGCGKATKHLQRSIDHVLKTLEQQKRFWKNYRLTQIRFKVKGKGRGNRGADPGRGVRMAARAMAERTR